MTDSTTPADDVIEQFRTHGEIPPLTNTDTILQHNEYVFIVHEPGEVTRVGVHRREDGSVHIHSIVRITRTRPRITPADDVITVGRVTHIDHGPGRGTRYIP